ncbi:MAG: C1 family peptidase [Verrucomicrobiales bacterium]|nr:C1 family peptidase [Verrucomicrobiales bacterium]
MKPEPVFTHFPSRKILMKESPAEEFARLQIGEATLDASIAMPPLPQSFSIRNEQTSVEDQGSAGTCTSFCVVACLEHIHQRDLSEAQVTHEAERAYDNCTEGLAMIHAYKICNSPGAVDEALWSYDPNQICWTTPPNIGGAARYRFGNIAYVYNRPRSQMLSSMSKASTSPMSPGLPLTLAIQQQLFSRRRNVSVSVPVVWAAWPWTGVITMPPPALMEEFAQTMSPPNTSGWHCIAICGWDNATARFLFKNSWGPYWGDKGYGTIPYQYIEAFSDTGMIGW